MDPVVVGALGELIATAVASAAGWSWESLQASPEEKTVREVIGAALTGALAGSALPAGTISDAQAARVMKAFETRVHGGGFRCLNRMRG